MFLLCEKRPKYDAFGFIKLKAKLVGLFLQNKVIFLFLQKQECV
jgi:hypothetical protein